MNNGSGSKAAVSAESSLIEGLKMVIHSRELENKMPGLKDTMLKAQQIDGPRLPPIVPEQKPLKSALKAAPFTTSAPSSSSTAENSIFSIFSDNDSLLPHERGGSDFSWIQTKTQDDFLKQMANEIEDEESFLYGSDESAASNPPQVPPASSSFTCPSLEGAEFDKIKNILKNVPSNSAEVKPQLLAPPNVSNPPALALPALNTPNVREALESLQCLIKATKEKRALEKGEREGSVSSQSSDKKMNAEEKQACKTKIDFLMKELEALLKQGGLGFLTPVIGFYCHKCEEFIGDLSTAEKHGDVHSSSGKPRGDKHSGDGKSHQKKDSKKHSPREHKEAKPPPVNPTNLYLREKLQEERMLITVSCGAETVQDNHKRERADSSSSCSSKDERGKKSQKKKKKKHKKNKKKK